VVTDSSGNELGHIRYLPSGTPRDWSGSLDTDKEFTGQRYDSTFILYYYGARYYDPLYRMFLSPDSIVPNPKKPQSLNRYSYCHNNPLRYTDPTGHQGSDATMVTVPGIMGQMALQTAQACGYTNYSIVGSSPGGGSSGGSGNTVTTTTGNAGTTTTSQTSATGADSNLPVSGGNSPGVNTPTTPQPTIPATPMFTPTPTPTPERVEFFAVVEVTGGVALIPAIPPVGLFVTGHGIATGYWGFIIITAGLGKIFGR